MNSRLPKLIFALLVFYAAVYFSFLYPQLPSVMASHFNARGGVNGWQSKQAFFGVFAMVGVVAIVVGFVIPRIVFALPAQLINLPNKNYWLAPERRAETTEFLSAYFAWFGCALYLILIFVFDYAIQFNLHPENPPSSARMWYVLIGFLLFSAFSSIRMLAKFLGPPPNSLPMK